MRQSRGSAHRLALAALLLAPAPALAAKASAPAFSASCPAGIAVQSNGKGKIRINGAKAIVSAYNDNTWAAKGSAVSINVSRDDTGLLVTYTSEAGHGVCQVTIAGAGAAAKASDVPKADRKACRAAVAAKAKGASAEVLEGYAAASGNTVILAVGPQKAKWRCLVSKGKVAEAAALGGQGTP